MIAKLAICTCRSCSSKCAQQSVHRLGVRTAFFSMFLACADSRIAGESTLPPQAGNAGRWALHSGKMTTSKKLNPAAIIALKEALTHIYWYRSDLRSFLVNTLSNPSILSTVNWDTVKRNIIDAVVETLARNEKNIRMNS